MDDNGLITIESAHPAAETLTRLESTLKAKDIQVFARIDHAAGAASVGLDLPLKALVWEDAAGQVFVTYSDPRWIARRHGLTGPAAEAAGRLATGLDGLVKAAAG